MGDQSNSTVIARKYGGSEDIYDELVGDKSNSWLFGLVAFAVVEEQKIEWVKHYSQHHGRAPQAEEIQRWYEELPPGAVLRAKGTAENALQLYSTEVLDEIVQETRKEIEASVVVGEIRDLKRFWPQLGVNLAGGLISSLLFALLLVAMAVVVLQDPSPVDWARGLQHHSETKADDAK